jgi:hypothetical protein
MIETRILCDRTDCKKPNAKRLHLYKDTKPDGAGSNEDWYYVFDLCAEDTHELLGNILDHFQRGVNLVSNDVLEFLHKKGINIRVE